MEKEQQGSLIGGILLIAGCCIGAGMLGLPVLTALAGFQPSLLFFILSWLFMMFTGLLLLEVNLWAGPGASIISMAGKTLGRFGQGLAWFLFLFLFYCIMVAYSSGSGVLAVDLIQENTGISIPAWVGSVAVALFFGFILFLGTRIVDWCNRFFMIGLFASYLFLVFLGLPHINFEFLKHSDWSEAFYVVPPMIISFGYHNLIPTLTEYLDGDAKRLRLTVIIGSSIPLIIYLLWEFLILGLIPVVSSAEVREAINQEELVTRILKAAVGSSLILYLAQAFAFFAIVTSFLGVGISFVDFMSDGLNIPKTIWGKFILCVIVVIPPLIFALIYPGVFLTALNYAGGFSAVILFGVLPALMAWKCRDPLIAKSTWHAPGGPLLLVSVIIFAVFVVVMELIYEFVNI